MKKFLYSFLLLLGSIALTACSDSDFLTSNVSPLAPSVQVSGTYQGNLYISKSTPLYDATTLLYATDSEGEPLTDDAGEQIPAAFNVSLDADADNSVTFKLYNFVFNRLNLGTLTLHYVGLQKDETTGRTTFTPEAAREYILGTESVGASRAVQAKIRVDEVTSFIEDGQFCIDLIFDWYKNGFEDESAVETYYIRYEGVITDEPVSDEPPFTPGAGPVSEQVAGTYQGRLNVSLDGAVYDESTLVYETDEYGTPLTDAQGNLVPGTFNVTLDADGDASVTFGLYNFGFMGMSLGNIVLHEIPLIQDKTTGRITFGANDPVQLTLGADFLGEENAIKATAKINEESSYIQNGHAFIDVEVVWFMVGFEDTETVQPIYVRYQGDIADDISSLVAGTYKGKLHVGLGEERYDDETLVYDTDEDGNSVVGSYNVTLDAEGPTSVTFGLYDFGFMGMSLGNIVLHNVPLVKDKTGESDRITFGYNAPVRLTLGAELLGEENAIKATAKIDEANSYIENGVAYIYVTVVWYMVDFDDTENIQPIYVRYEGEVQ